MLSAEIKQKEAATQFEKGCRSDSAQVAGPADMGRVMAVVKPKVSGQAGL